MQASIRFIFFLQMFSECCFAYAAAVGDPVLPFSFLDSVREAPCLQDSPHFPAQLYSYLFQNQEGVYRDLPGFPDSIINATNN